MYKRQGLGCDTAVVILPTGLSVCGKAAVPLIAAACLHEGLGHKQGTSTDNGGVVSPWQTVLRSDGFPCGRILDGDIAADLSVFPAWGIGGQRNDFLQQLAADQMCIRDSPRG